MTNQALALRRAAQKATGLPARCFHTRTEIQNRQEDGFRWTEYGEARLCTSYCPGHYSRTTATALAAAAYEIARENNCTVSILARTAGEPHIVDAWATSEYHDGGLVAIHTIGEDHPES